jgi:hypothetical protein
LKQDVTQNKAANSFGVAEEMHSSLERDKFK